MDAVGRARPDIAILVHLQAVAITGLDLVEDPSTGQRTVLGNIEDPDMLAWLRAGLVTCLRDVQTSLVGREGEPVRTFEVARGGPDISRGGIETIKGGRLLRP